MFLPVYLKMFDHHTEFYVLFKLSKAVTTTTQ